MRVRCGEQVEESGNHEAEDTGDDERVRAVQKEDAASGISGGDGAGGAVGGVVRTDRASVSKGGERAATGGSGANAADLFFTAVVQPIGPSGGGSAVRLGGDAPVCGHRPGERARARRNDGVQVSPSARAERVRGAAVRGGG